MTKKEPFAEGSGRYMALALEMVILTLAGLFIGQALGQKMGGAFETLGIIGGALGGFVLGAFSIYKTIELMDRKVVFKVGKNLCPMCLKGIPEDLEECPHCGYRRKTEE